MTIEQLKNEQSAPTTVICEPTHEKIAVRAYSIWKKAGKPQGCEQECWSQAKAELRAESQKLDEAICATLTIPQSEKKASLQINPPKSVKTKKRF
jgi:hypothetical protein